MEKHSIEATCPDCRGPLTKTEDEGITEFHCLVGHRYSPEGMLRAHYETEERALWAAVVALEEAGKMVEAVGRYVSSEVRRNLEQDAADKRRQAQTVRGVLDELNAYHL